MSVFTNQCFNLDLLDLEEYLLDPLAKDSFVRNWCGIPDDKYYSVSVCPVAGWVTLNGLNREVRAKKVSKSDQ